MSKEYVMQLEATIANLRRDNQLLKERLEAIDTAKFSEVTSEALDDIEEIIEELHERKVYGFAMKFGRIKNTIINSQEMKKAIDVIKKKHYDDYVLTFETYEAYQENANRVYEEELVIDWNNEEQLLELNLYTQQEFDLLQKWLKKDKSE